MNSNKSFLDRFIERIDAIDANSLQAYILHLSREKGFFETVFNAVREGILVVDRHLKIRYHNRAAKELLGLPDNLSKLRLSQFLQNVDWRRILQQDEDEWSKMARQEIEILYPQHRYLQFYLVPHEEDSSFATVILRDITESHERTMKEVRNESSQFVSMLAAGVAHEIGNPLNGLYLNLQILERMHRDEQPKPQREEVHEMIRACRSEVERLDNIIHQFLHAIRPGSPQFAPIDVRQLLVDTLTFMRQEIENRSIRVEFDCPKTLPVVSGDAAQLKQAFFNILKNATQSMPEGGSIEVICYYDDDFLMLEFADTGHGISADKLDRMFDAFKTFKKGGSGLGMIIIDRILREHGAEMDIETKEGEGTSIIVKFPRQGKRRVRVLPAPETEYPLSHFYQDDNTST